MERIINFRPLAQGLSNRDGKQVRENTILRSGEIGGASERDILALADYGVGYIYDFRSAEEVKRLPSLSSPFFATLHVDVIHEASPFTQGLMQMELDQGIRLMKQLYAVQFGTTDRYKPAIAAILAQKTDAFLYHCTAGKDRTGIFSAILMMAMDFGLDAVREEYLRIDMQQMQSVKAIALRQMDLPEDTARLDFVFSVRGEYIDVYLDTVMETHGSTDAYLEKVLGITAETKRFLQEKYLI